LLDRFITGKVCDFLLDKIWKDFLEYVFWKDFLEYLLCNCYIVPVLYFSVYHCNVCKCHSEEILFEILEKKTKKKDVHYYSSMCASNRIYTCKINMQMCSTRENKFDTHYCYAWHSLTNGHIIA
jgi:hypothetical protein